MKVKTFSLLEGNFAQGHFHIFLCHSSKKDMVTAGGWLVMMISVSQP